MMSMSKFFYWIIRLLSVGTFIVCFIAVAGIFIGMATWLIVAPLLPPSNAAIWQDIRCRFDMALNSDSECWDDVLERERVAYRTKIILLEKEKEKVVNLERKLRERLNEIKKIEGRFQTVSLFSEKDVDGLTITSGARYRQLNKGKSAVLEHAWCYTTHRRNGINASISIAELKKPSSIQINEVTAQEIRHLGNPNIDKLRAACTWPEGVS